MNPPGSDGRPVAATSRAGREPWPSGTSVPARQHIPVRHPSRCDPAAWAVHSGRRTQVPERALRTPRSARTGTAERVASQCLSPAVLNHSYRCCSHGVAIAALEDVDVDREVLFAAAMLHDTGAVSARGRRGLHPHQRPHRARGHRDRGVVHRRDRDDAHGHHAAPHPSGTLADGPEAYLLSATEAAAVPQGRVCFLRRYGAFDLAIRLTPTATETPVIPVISPGRAQPGRFHPGCH